jgi:hypothetical protein
MLSQIAPDYFPKSGRFPQGAGGPFFISDAPASMTFDGVKLFYVLGLSGIRWGNENSFIDGTPEDGIRLNRRAGSVAGRSCD